MDEKGIMLSVSTSASSLPNLAERDNSFSFYSTVLDDGSTVEACHVNGTVPNSMTKSLPSPILLHRYLQTHNWSLDENWQSLSIIYRVLNDLYCRQGFSYIQLVYLRFLRLIAVIGSEPKQTGNSESKGSGRREQSEVRDSATDGLQGIPVLPDTFAAHREESKTTTSPVETRNDGAADIDRRAKEEQPGYSSKPSQLSGDFKDDVPSKLVVYVIPGNFRRATISGTFRALLQNALQPVTNMLISQQRYVGRGYILGITDGDDVSYYVEKDVTLNQLMKATTTEATRKDLFSSIFGAERTLNTRSLARKEEKAKVKEKRSKGATSGATSKDSRHAPIRIWTSADDGNQMTSDAEIPTKEMSKYDEVLQLIGKEDKS